MSAMISGGRDIQLLAASARANGVLGAGGGGFSLADKLLARSYHSLIINAAQSEPLIYKDWAALAHYGECVLSGARLLIDALSLKKAFLASRDEFATALPELPAQVRKAGVVLSHLPDIYPLGYEKILKRELLGLAMDDAAAAEVLVVNAETLRNLSWAVLQQRPVITKLITVAGAVNRPISLQVPVGISFGECLALAGGASCMNYVVFHNGVLAGRPIDPAQAWVSATTLGYVLLPVDHSAVQAPRTTSGMDVRLNERRAAFFEHTLAGRTQAMSAAYALFDLTVYRRARPVFRALAASDAEPVRVRIAPAGKAHSFQPVVAVGECVQRGQMLATQPESDDLARHASVDGVVEMVDASGITVRRTYTNEVHA